MAGTLLNNCFVIIIGGWCSLATGTCVLCCGDETDPYSLLIGGWYRDGEVGTATEDDGFIIGWYCSGDETYVSLFGGDETEAY